MKPGGSNMPNPEYEMFYETNDWFLKKKKSMKRRVGEGKVIYNKGDKRDLRRGS